MPDQPAHQRGGRILVVDDEPHIRRVLCTILTSDGFDVIEAKDGTEGMDAVRSDAEYDFILLDFMMPGATGLEILARVRADSRRAETPVIILTAKGQDTDREAAMAGGADDFLTIPFSPKKLVARIREILDAD
ncbi:MAG: response regulator [Gemmatimonadota bacterium]|nr:response regulator [Gemmatimonadota bacterium]